MGIAVGLIAALVLHGALAQRELRMRRSGRRARHLPEPELFMLLFTSRRHSEFLPMISGPSMCMGTMSMQAAYHSRTSTEEDGRALFIHLEAPSY